MTRLLVLADTHVRRGSSRRLPDDVYDLLGAVDAVWHAGDVLIPELLDELAGFAPVTAVLGNNDAELLGILPETAEETIGGVRLAMIHDAGPTKGRARRMARRFPDADVVIYGHSHQPDHVEPDDGPVLLNPGSPTERRRAPSHTVAVVDLVDGDARIELRDVG